MESFLASLVKDTRIGPCAVYRGVAAARPARLAEPSVPWPPGAREALAALGIGRLYAHQAEALERAVRGQNVLLATPTASGKTLAYLMAFLAARRQDDGARAIFLYPLKALARDQLAVVRRVLAPLGYSAAEAAEVYDGDTPDALRRRIRRAPPAVILTNPDMLHLGILPSHDTWGGFLAQLGLVVVDEAHVYRGIFGAHVHHTLRRLLRLARHHGAHPLLLAGSATIGEPQAFVETLTGELFAAIRDSGAPAALRHVLFLDPRGESPYTIATRVVGEAVAAGHKTIAFTKARRITELMHQWLRQQRPELMPRIASYRSGYLPEERREIERRLFAGELTGVISTSALEAGIDVGGLDVCVLVGYPGSLANAWQRIGRTGRQDRESLAILVALPDALDHYVTRHPEHFFSGEFERVVLDPGNDAIADAHLEAAAAERSIDPADVIQLQGVHGMERVRRLVSAGKLVEVEGDERWFALRRQPQRDIALRSAGTAYALKLRDGREIGSMDGARAWFEGHPGAIYLHAGQSYRALSLERETRTITLEPADVDYFTQIYARKETEILETFEERPVGAGRLAWGRVRVTTFVEGYGKRRLFGQDEISRHPLDAPPQVLETVSFWFVFPEELLPQLVADEYHPAGSLHAAEHASIGLFPLLAICDRWDLGGISYAHHPQFDRPAIFVYDGWPGGVGLARTGFARAEELFGRTRALIAACPCEDGCPACVHSPKCGSGNNPLDKLGALVVLGVATGEVVPRPVALPGGAVASALATHRSKAHAGVRGGGELPDDFFSGGPAGEGDAVVEPDATRGRPPCRPDHAAAAGSTGDFGPARRPAPTVLTATDWPEGLPLPSDLLRPEDGRWLFFDLETLRGADEVGGWDRIRDMGLALAVTLDATTGHFTTWLERDTDALAGALLAADRVVGFNLDRFDLTVVEAYAGPRIRQVRSLDLLTLIHQRLGFRVSLGHLAQETLGAPKLADGLQSLAWVREGRMDLVEPYCRADVRLTAALWVHGRARGHVLFRNREGLRGKVPVDW